MLIKIAKLLDCEKPYMCRIAEEIEDNPVMWWLFFWGLAGAYLLCIAVVVGWLK